jgi:hypothetical protein
MRMIWRALLLLALVVGGYDIYLRATAQSFVSGGTWIPVRGDEGYSSINGNTYVLDATGEIACLVFQAPKTGNLSRFETYVAVVTNAPDNAVRFSFQDVDTSTGLPDGTPDQSTTVAGGSVLVGWLSPGDFGASRAVTRGNILAACVDTPNFTAADNFALGGRVQSTSSGFPYGVSATTTKQATTLPIFAVRYDDGTYAYLAPEMWAVQQVSSRAYQNDTTPDEFGLRFQVPFPTTLKAVAIHARMNANNTADLVVYDDADMVLDTQTIDSDIGQSSAGLRYLVYTLTADVPIEEDREYRVVLKAGSATINTEIWYSVFASEALMQTSDAGHLFVATQRTNDGAWTDYDNSGDGFLKPSISLLFTAFDDGAGGGSGFFPSLSN